MSKHIFIRLPVTTIQYSFECDVDKRTRPMFLNRRVIKHFCYVTKTFIVVLVRLTTGLD